MSNKTLYEIYDDIRNCREVERYQKALKQQPAIWLGEDNIPGTEAYKAKEELCNNIWDNFNKWKKEKEGSKK